MKKKIRPYAPLTVLNERDPQLIGYNQPRFIFKNNLGTDILEDVPEDEFVEFVLSEDFYNPKYKGPFKKINTAVFALTGPVCRRILHMSDKEIADNPFAVRCEWRDFLLCDIFLERWAKCKVSYRPDEDFLCALADTKELKLTRDILGHLPSKCFYIDLTDLKNIGTLHGMLVNVLGDDEKMAIVMLLITDDRQIFSFYSGGYYKEDDSITIDFTEIQNRDYRVCDENISLDNVYRDRKFMAIVGYQMIAYLSSKEPDITEPIGKKVVHRAASSTRHNYSEIDMYDVGVRFGTAFRAEKKKREIALSCLTGGRKSPIPHFRSAHWQRYHVGTGRTEIVTKWIEPTFVGGEVKDVVIKKVRNQNG